DLDKFVIIDNLVITGSDEPLSLEYSAIEEPLCNGNSNGSIEVEFAGGTPGYEYDWSNGDNTQNISGLDAGNYTLTVTDNNGCTILQSFLVDEPDALAVEGEVSTENCDMQNGTVTLDISGGVGGYVISSSDGEIVGNQVTELSDGTVTIFVEDANGCEWENSYEIEDFPGPEAEIQQGDDLTCLDNTTSLTAIAWSGTGDYEYSWSTSGGHIVSGQNTQTINIDEEGTYFLLVTDFITGCEFETDIVVVVEVILPDVDAGADFPINCENNEPVIQGSGDSLNSITWTTQNGNIVSGGNTYTPVVDAPGTYFINVVHSGTGCSNVDTVIVNDNLDSAQAAYSYQSSSLTIVTSDQSTGSNLSGWFWTFGDGNLSNENSPVHTYANEGTYEVCLSVENGCDSSTTCSQVSVIFQGSLLSVLEEITHVACNGDSSGAISLIVNGGSGVYSYSWTGPGGSSYDTSEISGLVSGQYVVIISDDQGNSVVGDYTVLQPDAIQVDSSFVTDNLCNGETNGSIALEMSGG
ncbi:MAG: PKD domain-containing protein, partial [Saprospiraceae bacterium]